MNETDREVIEEMLDNIAHLEIKRYGEFARVMVERLQIGNLPDDVRDIFTLKELGLKRHQTPAPLGDWMDGFVTALEWVLEELDGVRVV